jgi:hypothetical protein
MLAGALDRIVVIISFSPLLEYGSLVAANLAHTSLTMRHNLVYRGWHSGPYSVAGLFTARDWCATRSRNGSRS